MAERSASAAELLPTMMSNYLYVNPHKGMMTDAKNRTAVLQAINVDELVKQTYFGRGDVARQIYPPNMMASDFANQAVAHDPSALTGIAAGLPADQKAITIGYDSSNPDNQLVSNLLQTQLAAAGLTAKGRHRRPVGSGDLHRTGLARRPVAVHLGPHFVGPGRRPELPGLFGTTGHRRAGKWPAHR